jgi:hypothetical protein
MEAVFDGFEGYIGCFEGILRVLGSIFTCFEDVFCHADYV